MTGDPHFGFILAAYIAGVAVIGGMVVWTLVDYATLKNTLARLAAKAGIDADRL
jgi:heme exporter protein CcmD